MLLIKTKENGKTQCYTWYVGLVPIAKSITDNAFLIEVDGNELDYLKKKSLTAVGEYNKAYRCSDKTLISGFLNDIFSRDVEKLESRTLYYTEDFELHEDDAGAIHIKSKEYEGGCRVYFEGGKFYITVHKDILARVTLQC